MLKASVISQRLLKDNFALLWLDKTPLKKPPRPGQFVMLRSWSTLEPLLARPFSIHDLNEKAFAVLYQIKGRGTSLLSQVRRGQKLSVLGPLGKGFPTPPTPKVILVAGGIGIAPFLFAARWLKAQNYKIHLFYGARSRKDLLRLTAFRALKIPVTITTEDGSAGHKGLITTPLSQTLKDKAVTVFACGPLPMLRAVARLTQEHNTPAYLSLESRMACGLGLCLGCVVETKHGYIHVCQEGPVIEAANLLND